MWEKSFVFIIIIIVLRSHYRYGLVGCDAAFTHSGGPGFKFRILYFGFLCDDCGDDTEAVPFRPSAGNQVEYSRMSLISASAGLFLHLVVTNKYPLS